MAEQQSPDGNTVREWILGYNQDPDSEKGLELRAKISSSVKSGALYVDAGHVDRNEYRMVGVAERYAWSRDRSARDSFFVVLQPEHLRAPQWIVIPLLDFLIVDARVTPMPSDLEGPRFELVKE